MKVFTFLSLLFYLSGISAGNSIEVSEPWVNQVPPNILNNAGYMTIRNNGSEPVKLLEISSPQFGMSHLHVSKMQDGLMKMLPVSEFEIPQNGVVVLEPAGLHIMLMNRLNSLSKGDEVQINLKFSDDQQISVQAEVR